MKKRPSARVVRTPAAAPLPATRRAPTKRKFVEYALPRGWICIFSVMFARKVPGTWGVPCGRFKTRADAERVARKTGRVFQVVFGFEDWRGATPVWTKHMKKP